MNKFINNPDSPGALAACAFWLVAFAAGAAATVTVLVRLAGLAR